MPQIECYRKIWRRSCGRRHEQNGETRAAASIRDRYRESSRKDKSKILDEFIAVTGHHRKHGIRLLARS